MFDDGFSIRQFTQKKGVFFSCEENDAETLIDATDCLTKLIVVLVFHL